MSTEDAADTQTMTADDPAIDTDVAGGADEAAGDSAPAGNPVNGAATSAVAEATDNRGDNAVDEASDDDASDDGEDDAADDGDAGSAGSRAENLLVREGDVAADYLEQLLDIVDYDGDIDLDVENGRAIVAVVGSDLTPLVGPNGVTLDALQELTRLAVQQQTGVRSRLMLDVSGHRNQRRLQLTDLANSTAKTVIETAQPVRLAPMNPFERKVVHDAISAIDGVQSESEGDEPDRCVVVHPVG